MRACVTRTHTHTLLIISPIFFDCSCVCACVCVFVFACQLVSSHVSRYFLFLSVLSVRQPSPCTEVREATYFAHPPPVVLSCLLLLFAQKSRFLPVTIAAHYLVNVFPIFFFYFTPTFAHAGRCFSRGLLHAQGLHGGRDRLVCRSTQLVIDARHVTVPPPLFSPTHPHLRNRHWNRCVPMCMCVSTLPTDMQC